VCNVVTEPDRIEFNRASIEVARIKEDADYEGVRVKFHAVLAKARVPMQVDIGFGDVVVPGPTKIEYPTLLDFPAPVLQAYPREAVIAEKLEAISKLGLLNSRMKDYYDIALLSRMCPFEGENLVEAILASRVWAIQLDPGSPHSKPGRDREWDQEVQRASNFQDLCQFRQY
jgi:hypothetical protein